MLAMIINIDSWCIKTCTNKTYKQTFICEDKLNIEVHKKWKGKKPYQHSPNFLFTHQNPKFQCARAYNCYKNVKEHEIIEMQKSIILVNCKFLKKLDGECDCCFICLLNKMHYIHNEKLSMTCWNNDRACNNINEKA